MITLYWSPQSSAIRVRWMLEELAISYSVREIDIAGDRSLDPDDFLEASPIGKVPALRDGDELISGSATICLYLVDRYAPARLAPAVSAPGRARFLFWMFFSPASIEPAMMEKFMGLTPNKAAAPWGTWDLMVHTLEEGLTRDAFVAGPEFSAADVMIASSCGNLQKLGLLQPSGTTQDYLERCFSRSAYRKASSFE